MRGTNNIIRLLNKLESKLNDQNILLKKALNLKEAAFYTGYSASHIYKLTSWGKIPHYKPHGKIIFFDRLELDEWLLSNKVSSNN